jgi:predicted transcriptional regulator
VRNNCRKPTSPYLTESPLDIKAGNLDAVITASRSAYFQWIATENQFYSKLALIFSSHSNDTADTIKNDFVQLDFIAKKQPLTKNIMHITQKGKQLITFILSTVTNNTEII